MALLTRERKRAAQLADRSITPRQPEDHNNMLTLYLVVAYLAIAVATGAFLRRSGPND